MNVKARNKFITVSKKISNTRLFAALVPITWYMAKGRETERYPHTAPFVITKNLARKQQSRNKNPTAFTFICCNITKHLQQLSFYENPNLKVGISLYWAWNSTVWVEKGSVWSAVPIAKAPPNVPKIATILRIRFNMEITLIPFTPDCLGSSQGSSGFIFQGSVVCVADRQLLILVEKNILGIVQNSIQKQVWMLQYDPPMGWDFGGTV